MLANYFLNAPDFTALKAHFYAMRMRRRVSQNGFHDSAGQGAAALIRFLNDQYF